MNEPGGHILGPGMRVLVPIVVGLFVVLRFLMRELRDRRIPFNRFYAVPIVVGVVALAVAYSALSAAPYYALQLAGGTVVAIVLGVGIGLAVDRFTSVRLGPGGTSAILRGSWATVAIWLAALALRLAGRYFIFGIGVRALGVSLTLNAVLLVLLFVAMIVSRIRLYARAAALRAGSIVA